MRPSSVSGPELVENTEAHGLFPDLQLPVHFVAAISIFKALLWVPGPGLALPQLLTTTW